MAKMLHIETSTEQCGVALSDGATLLAHKELLAKGFKHAAQLHPFIDQVLNETGLAPNQLEAVSVSAGPGSYTGLRIGTVAAKGLCFALDIPLIAIPTLAVLAAPHWEHTKVVALLDARRDEVYATTFNVGGKELNQTQAHILTADSFAEISDETVCFVGTGAAKAQEIIPKHTNWTFLPTHPTALTMPALAQKAYAEQQFSPLETFVPRYIKPVRITSSKKDALGRMV